MQLSRSMMSLAIVVCCLVDSTISFAAGLFIVVFFVVRTVGSMVVCRMSFAIVVCCLVDSTVFFAAGFFIVVFIVITTVYPGIFTVMIALMMSPMC